MTKFTLISALTATMITTASADFSFGEMFTDMKDSSTIFSQDLKDTTATLSKDFNNASKTVSAKSTSTVKTISDNASAE